MVISVIGKATPRVEGAEKVTGAALYTADIVRPGTLWVRVLRSSRSHARIVSIDTSAAEKLPGVRAVLTGADVGDGLNRTRLDRAYQKSHLELLAHYPVDGILSVIAIGKAGGLLVAAQAQQLFQYYMVNDADLQFLVQLRVKVGHHLANGGKIT